jgi:predicted dehydrogenase
MERIGIGLIGYGMIGKIHTLGYREIPLIYPEKAPGIDLAAVCTRSEDTARAAAAGGGYAGWHTDPEQLIRDPAVSVVDCSYPNFEHRRILLAAAAAGKPVYCEKPLALNAAEAREVAAAARQAGIAVGMTFNYRFIPALMRARQMIAAGALGDIYNFRAGYLHSGYEDPTRPLSWRLQKRLAGGGALVDLGAHIIDLVRHLLGEFQAVRATTRTYVAERPLQRGAADKGPVDVDDAAWMEARLACGASGTLEASRFATGALDDLNLEIYGEKGALRFQLMDANWLHWYDASKAGSPIGGERGWTRIETIQSYPGAVLPPPRSILGWTRTHTENQYAFLSALAAGRRPEPDIEDGLRAQLVLEAAYASAASGAWVSVPLQ